MRILVRLKESEEDVGEVEVELSLMRAAIESTSKTEMAFASGSSVVRSTFKMEPIMKVSFVGAMVLESAEESMGRIGWLVGRERHSLRSRGASDGSREEIASIS